jgi:putative radical SAM enzyme (TIGR03279 family)
MPLKINDIASGSLVAGKLLPGDLLISINGKQISDFLDLQFHSSDEELVIEYSREKGIVEEVIIDNDWQTPMGIEPVPHRCRTCANNCIFCFVDQMRPFFRETLYVKDDDYRLSFVHGNFITLTNLTSRDLEKIIEQRLSPLYISVHTTDPVLHKKMLRYKQDFNILETLQMLGKNNIELHTQIVIIPDWNDGDALERSLTDLTSPEINSLSVGIVPVGLTQYRKDLIEIKPVDAENAEEILLQASKFPNTYCSDEIYLTADVSIPPPEFYNDFPQLENGIGMISLLLENWRINKSEFVKFLKPIDKDLVLITGDLAFKAISSIADDIKKLINNNVQVQKVLNNFLGHNVTVTGLLSGKDILEQTTLSNNEIALVSSAIFNNDDLTLDNLTIDGFKKQINSSVIVIDELFDSWKLI